jgi:hypothetical protein
MWRSGNGSARFRLERQTMGQQTICDGAIAQLGERYNGIVEVSGSIPLSSTNRFTKTRQPAGFCFSTVILCAAGQAATSRPATASYNAASLSAARRKSPEARSWRDTTPSAAR